ncbi:MAG: DUF3179 domain-containing protein [Chloroflexaceae bacterium]
MHKRLIAGMLFGMLFLTACGANGSVAPAAPSEPAAAQSASATAAATPTSAAANTAGLTATVEPDSVERPSWASANWQTNFARHSVPFDEIMSGGVGRDGIPSIDAPEFVSNTEAQEWLADNEPVIALAIDGDARAYPLQILTWHEIVNDTVGDVPVAVTFCPLCNSAIVFDRRVAGEVYEFGVSGLLRNSDLVMYDRTSESLWQQFTGEAIIGDLTGTQLTFLPSSLISFADFQAAYPEGQVLSQDTGFNRRYGVNPYTNYDAGGGTPFLFDGEIDERLPAMERVVAVTLTNADGTTVDIAYPFSQLTEAGVINDTEHNLVVFHLPGTSSALGATRIAEGADVGAAGVFDPRLDDQTLTFRREGATIVDEQTGSTWNILGEATSGALEGRQLTPIIHGNHFWFAWAAFHPDRLVHSP